MATAPLCGGGCAPCPFSLSAPYCGRLLSPCAHACGQGPSCPSCLSSHLCPLCACAGVVPAPRAEHGARWMAGPVLLLRGGPPMTPDAFARGEAFAPPPLLVLGANCGTCPCPTAAMSGSAHSSTYAGPWPTGSGQFSSNISRKLFALPSPCPCSGGAPVPEAAVSWKPESPVMGCVPGEVVPLPPCACVG